MDDIQRVLIKAGRKDLAQRYYEKVSGRVLYVVKATAWGKKNETISQPMDKNKAEKFVKDMEEQMKIAIPKYRAFKDIRIEEYKKSNKDEEELDFQKESKPVMDLRIEKIW